MYCLKKYDDAPPLNPTSKAAEGKRMICDYFADISHVKNSVICSHWMILIHPKLKCNWRRCTHVTEKQTGNLIDTSSL